MEFLRKIIGISLKFSMVFLRRISEALLLSFKFFISNSVTIGSCLLVFLIAFFSYIHLTRATIVLNEISLPTKLIDSGFVSSLVTYNALHELPGIILKKVESSRKAPIGSIHQTSGGAECNRREELYVPGMEDFIVQSIQKAYSRSEIPDWSVSKEAFSLFGLIRFFKQELDIHYVEITPSVVEVEGNFVLQIVVYSDQNQPHKMEYEPCLSG